MKLRNWIVISMVLILSAGCDNRHPRKISFCTWDYEWMAQVKKACKKGNCQYSAAINALTADADETLTKEPLRLTEKKNIPSDITLNDYVSFPPSWWPNSVSPDGLPYVRRDGEINPAHNADCKQLQMMAERVRALSLAWFFTGEKKYATQAAKQLKSWFIDPQTRMNPNLSFAQSIPGRSEGRATGIAEAQPLAQLIEPILLLETSPAMQETDFQEIKNWYSEFFNWLINSQQGSDAANYPNGNAISYDFQTITIAHFLGDTQFVMDKLTEIPALRIGRMIDAGGKQPAELNRNESFSHSVANLENWFDLGEIGLKYDIDIFSYKSETGASLQQALDFLCGFLGNRDNWQWPQTEEWSRAENRLGLLTRRAARYFKNPEYEIIWEQAFAERLNSNWNLLVFSEL